MAIIGLHGQNMSFNSKLPLVFIDTKGETITDTPKIKARMGIVWNGSGKTNSTSDTINDYNGFIGIEIRGSSTQMFPKKSYGVETRDEDGRDTSVSLIGLPPENDWVLYAPYTDKSMIRNALTFTLAAQFTTYVTRNRFVEVFLNNKYEGVYMLMEKIKRDKNRVNIARLDSDDLAGDSLTGGYIIKIDKTSGSSGSGWYSAFKNANNSNTYYQYHYPESDKIAEVQKGYIKNYIKEFESAIYSRNFDPLTGYQAYIEQTSFFDYIIMSEFAKNIDGYRLSTYLFKDKKGKLNAGPLWDFNLGYGNANYGELAKPWDTYGLQIYADMGNDLWQKPFWWTFLLSDRNFSNNLKCRWEALRAYYLSNDRIFSVADSLVNEIGDAVNRNYQRWPIIGQWIWPNYYVGNSYADEVSWMKNWLTNRLLYLNSALPGICGGEVPPTYNGFDIHAGNNPFNSELSFQIGSENNVILKFYLYTVNGTLVKTEEMKVSPGLNVYKINTQNLPQGMFIYRILKGNNVAATAKVIKI